MLSRAYLIGDIEQYARTVV